MMKLRFLTFLLIITAPAFTQSLNQKIGSAFTNLKNDSQLKYGQASLTVINARTGDIIYASNEKIGLSPASTLKTVTSATAFNILGEDFRWETSIGYNGTISNGTLKGDLIIRGSGDPTLGSHRYAETKADMILDKWIKAVKQAGIEKIEGRIISDDQLFGTQIIPQGWIWQDIGNYYGAGASSVSWRENEIGVTFKAGSKTGSPAKLVSLSPSILDLRAINEVSTGPSGSGDNVYAYSAPYTEVVYLRGTYGLDLNKTIKISCPDPALSLAIELRNKLLASGISSLTASTWRKLNAENLTFEPIAKILGSHESPSLSQVVYWLNQKSLNLYAENILKTIAVKLGKAGSFDNGTEEVKRFWRDKIGIDPNSLDVLDGSGLSPENKVTTEVIARILLSVKKETWFNDYHESFPLYNNMKMKSGSIRNALCYAGFQTTADGTPVVFSIITNNYNGSTAGIKQKIFRVLDGLK
ncbi:D-alanyl-D-alanine carboxypeptidase/D-alanyl-D-alanine endopeptidase [Desertivirga brevis]|uniref:D-alanyl-D-alanine carboxypeptidase/D-alanyl-D-alanine endopeptidase n=1 Tax=Desertivirga brevis TaxID=2810310 RepID=UPI001F61360D|nr:D-alanyl-D-alanine carboxypeptidase/D-alanyl-D-alanine-endopeptidase [Pedobacter sp. SYSU D00873]